MVHMRRHQWDGRGRCLRKKKKRHSSQPNPKSRDSGRSYCGLSKIVWTDPLFSGALVQFLTIYRPGQLGRPTSSRTCSETSMFTPTTFTRSLRNHVVAQHLASAVIFVTSFCRKCYEVVSPVSVVAISTLLTVAGWVVWDIGWRSERPQRNAP